MIGHRQVQPEQVEDGADQPLGLPQRQTEHRPQYQRRGDRQVRVVGLPTRCGAWRRCRFLLKIFMLPDQGRIDESTGSMQNLRLKNFLLPNAFAGGPLGHGTAIRRSTR